MMKRVLSSSKQLLAVLSIGILAACEQTAPMAPDTDFVIAVVPDTQNMVSYKHQKQEGFALNGGEQFLEEMQTIADWRDQDGDKLAFVVGVGDVWQHQSETMDEHHKKRGFESTYNPYFATEIAVTDRVLSEEIPRAKEGYQKLADAEIPFGVAPGNHDHDAMWSVSEFPPQMDIDPRKIRMVPEILGLLHIGGLNNFRSIFGADKPFYADKTWYVDSHNGGASSAQTFKGGGYTFLHIALEMQASDEVISWANSVIDGHPSTPTIISMHDYLNTDGERLPNPIVDLALIDPEHHNSAEQLWEKLISKRDEIFLVLSGHQHGQNRRLDKNVNGHQVHQILADFQGRGQSGLDAGQPMDTRRRKPYGLGDGWFRVMDFEMGGETPRIKVRTYSSHYKKFSSEIPEYAKWYRNYEQRKMSDEEFLAHDEFELELPDFKARFKG